MKLLSDLLYDARILEVRGTTNLAVEDVAVDSRKVKPLGLFVAVPGTVVDGHDFIPQALDAGAAGGGRGTSSIRGARRAAVGANLHFPKYFEKYARLAREEKFPEIYRTRDRILLFVSALYGFRVLH